MRLEWMELPRMFSTQTMWGAARPEYTFIVTDDIEEGIHASVKVIGATPFDSTRHDLGKFGSVADAKAACERFRPT